MIDFKSNKSFCSFLFKAGVLGYQGKIVPCCRWDAGNPDDNTTRGKDQRYEISDSKYGDRKILFENLYQDARKKAIAGEKIEQCRRCYQEEYISGKSLRTRSLQAYRYKSQKDLENDNRWVRAIRAPHGLLSEISIPKLEYLEIESGRYCNLKCRTCGPNLSTSYDEDYNEEMSTNFFGDDKMAWKEKMKMPPINESLARLTYDDCKHLKELKVTGGEPFLTDSFLKFMENLVEWDLAKNITMEIFTNSSFFPKQKHINLLPKFKQVLLNLSIDDVGNRAEFIRKKSKWDVVSKVSKKWEKLSLANDHIRLHTSFTISILNALYVAEYFKWVINHFDQKTFGFSDDEYTADFIQYQIVAYPDYLSVMNISPQSSKKLLGKLNDQLCELSDFLKQKKIKHELQKLEDGKHYSLNILDKRYNRLRPCTRDIFNQLVNYITQTKEEKRNNLEDIFYKKTEMFDKIRNDNWRKTFPELVKLLDE